MKVPERSKLLISTDGSEYSLGTVRYVSSILDPERFHVVLFHVLTRVPESFIDLEKMPAYRYRLVSVETWEKQQEQTVESYMQKAKAILFKAGFPEEAVSVKIQERKVGIGRDIAAESREGYCAVAVGRKGLSELKDFMLGSIANKILELVSIPIWVIGGTELPQKILLCLDSSEGAMVSARHLSSIVCGSESCNVVLFHAAGGFGAFRKLMREVFSSEEDKRAAKKMEIQLKESAKLLEPSFDKARGLLLSGGIDSGRIDQKIVSGVNSIANAIIDEAEKGKFDTIVLGRRGLSRVEEFVMGRVSNKVVHMAKKKTVWVVN